MAESTSTPAPEAQQDCPDRPDQQLDTAASESAGAEAAPVPFEPTPEQQEAIDRAEALKAEGNEAYKRGDEQGYHEAISKYWEAVDLAPKEAPQRAVYYANLAAASLQLGQHREVIEHCNAALAVDPALVKALVRRATAAEHLEEYEGALADARKVLELDASSSWAQAAVQRLEPLVKERQERMKEEVLGKLKDLGNSLLGKFGLSLDNFKAEQDPASGGYSIKFQQ